jgi:hypothetical protein
MMQKSSQLSQGLNDLSIVKRPESPDPYHTNTENVFIYFHSFISYFLRYYGSTMAIAPFPPHTASTKTGSPTGSPT